MAGTDFQNILYEKMGRRLTITINRQDKLNACDSETTAELYDAFLRAWADKEVGCVVLTGAGDKAFCTGGDQGTRTSNGYTRALEGKHPISDLPLEESWQFVTFLIRHIPKPVVARVNGYAIGGGHVWQVNCDLSIAADSAIFGQAGPRVGSFDPGFGTGELSRSVGVKRAKEMWYLARKYSAEEAKAMGLVNFVVPGNSLDSEVDKVCDELLSKSPTALKMLKYSFLAESEGLSGVTELGVGGLSLYYRTPESVEGRNAFIEKRKPNFWKYFE